MTKNANESKDQQSMTDFANESKEGRPVSPEEVYAHKEVIIYVVMKMRHSKDYHSAEDLLQELAIKCWQSQKIRYNPAKGPLTNYLITIAKNMVRDQWRKKRRVKIEYTVDDETTKTPDIIAPNDSDEKKYKQQVRVLDRAIAVLYRQYPSKKTIDAFVEFTGQGMPAKKVAKDLGVNERYVNTSVSRCTKRLKKIARCLEKEEEWLTSAD